MFRVDILAMGETSWSNNNLTFGTVAEAEAYARGLYYRWTMMDKARIVPADHPKREQYVPGTENVNL